MTYNKQEISQPLLPHHNPQPSASSIRRKTSQMSVQLVQPRNWYQRTFVNIIQGSVRSSIAALTWSQMGVGILTLPYVFYNTGIALGIVLLLFCGLLNGYFYSIVVKTMDYTQTYCYVELFNILYGKTVRRLMEMFLILMQFGQLCTYQAIVTQFFYNFAITFELIQSTDQWFKYCLVIVYNLVLLLPLLFIKKALPMRYQSILSVMVMIYITLILIIQFPAYHAKGSLQNIKFFEFNDNLYKCIVLLMFSFDTIVRIPDIYLQLNQRSEQRMGKVIHRSIFCSGLLYLLVACFGYFCNTVNTPELITSQIGPMGNTNWPMIIGKIIIALSLVGNISFILKNLASNILQGLPGIDYNYSSLLYFTIVFFLLALSIIVALIVEKIMLLFLILGGFLLIPYTCISTFLMYIKTQQNTSSKVLLAVVNAIVTAIGIYSGVHVLVSN